MYLSMYVSMYVWGKRAATGYGNTLAAAFPIKGVYEYYRVLVLYCIIILIYL